MHPIQKLSLCAACAAWLSACAVPGPAAAPVVPGTVGLGPECGPQPYPFHALQDIERGQVLVRGVVGADHRVEKPVMEQSTRSPYLNAAALVSAASCRVPASPPGTPVRLLVVYDFVSDGEFPPQGLVRIAFAPSAAVPAAR